MTTFTYQTKNIAGEQVHQMCHQLAHIYDRKRNSRYWKRKAASKFSI